MKKWITVLSLLGFATLAFGQDAAKPAPALELSGYLDTGITVLANGADKALLGLWGDDAGVNGGRLKLIGRYDNGNLGLSFETRWDGLIGTNDLTKYPAGTQPIPVYFKHAYAYANFFDKLLTVQMGMVKEESTKTGGNKNFKYATEVPGAAIVVRPIADLAFQALVAPGVGKSPSLSEAVGNFVDTVTAFSAAYTIKSLGRGSAGVKFAGTVLGTYAANSLYAGINVYAVPNLAATVEAALEGLNTGKQEGLTTIVETLNYNFKDLGVSPFSLGLVAYEYLYDKDLTTTDASNATIARDWSFRIQPSASYVVDAGLTANLGFAYQKGFVVTTDAYSSDLGKSAGVPVKALKNDNRVATFEVKPSAKLTLTKTQALTLTYAYTLSTGEDDVLFITTNKGARAMQTVQASYTYSF